MQVKTGNNVGEDSDATSHNILCKSGKEPDGSSEAANLHKDCSNKDSQSPKPKSPSVCNAAKDLEKPRGAPQKRNNPLKGSPSKTQATSNVPSPHKKIRKASTTQKHKKTAYCVFCDEHHEQVKGMHMSFWSHGLLVDLLQRAVQICTPIIA
jgi:hypothetical protein